MGKWGPIVERIRYVTTAVKIVTTGTQGPMHVFKNLCLVAQSTLGDHDCTLPRQDSFAVRDAITFAENKAVFVLDIKEKDEA